jgi:hypothetical protein
MGNNVFDRVDQSLGTTTLGGPGGSLVPAHSSSLALQGQQGTGLGQFDVRNLPLEKGLPFTAQRDLYKRAVQVVGGKYLELLREQCDHAIAVRRDINEATRTQLRESLQTVLTEVVAREAVAQQDIKSGCVIELFDGFNGRRKQLESRLGDWPEWAVSLVYEKIAQLHVQAAERICAYGVPSSGPAK